MPTLPMEVREELEEPITAAELGVALANSKPRKAPGPDGLTPTYYKTFFDTLSRPLVTALNSITVGNSFPVDTLRAYISLIPKEGKDPLRCGNYRPIALLNTDLKLFAKILANRLLSHIPSLVHRDQAGFVPLREPRDNTIRVVNLIHAARTSKRALLLLSTDAEKAFDRVDWAFIRATLEHIGLRSSMLGWILSLYSHPTAAVKVNETRSDFFNISNGTRQGCPLSPLIFILSLEPLLCRIRADAGIIGYQKSSGSHKVAAFADDLIFFLTEPLTSLPNLLQSLQEYGALSLFQINLSKSSILNITVGRDIVQRLRSAFPLRWATNLIRYLGVDITSDPAALYSANFAPLLPRLKADLLHWHSLTLTWFGRCSALKMTMLPRVLYLLQALPIRLPSVFFKRIDSMFRDFVWSHRKPRIRLRLLHLPKSRGGVGLPDMKAYYRAAHLTRLVDWHCHAEAKHWVTMEMEDSRDTAKSWPWITTPLPRDLADHPTLGSTLSVARDAFRHSSVSPLPSPMVPVLGNPEFTPGFQSPHFKRLVAGGRLRLCDFLGPNGQLSPEAGVSATDPPLDFWSGLQLRNFLRRCLRTPGISRQLTEFENICRRGEPVRHSLSLIYSSLIRPAEGFVPPFLSKWEAELGIQFTDPQREKILYFAQKSSIATRVQETCYKIMTRWYRVPTTLHHFFPQVSNLCWHCGTAEGTMLHVFWACPTLSPFWLEVARTINHLTGVSLEGNPAACLLHLTERPIKKYKASLTIQLLNAAKACILLCWRSGNPPAKSLWFSKVNELRDMEDLTATLHNREETFRETWRPWQHFIYTDAYLREVAQSD